MSFFLCQIYYHTFISTLIHIFSFYVLLQKETCLIHRKYTVCFFQEKFKQIFAKRKFLKKNIYIQLKKFKKGLLHYQNG